jgi:GT2 family glycosyltransferase/glycosyltransferase involved in cell wall biosynthesis
MSVPAARSLARAFLPFKVRRALGIALWRRRDVLRRKALHRRGQKSPPPVIPGGRSDERLAFKACKRPRVSIIVPVHNEWEYTHRCLKAVLTHTGRYDYEVIVADDASTDVTKTAEAVLENVLILRDGIRRGFLENSNHAAQHARGDYLLFLNNDTVVQPGWLEALLTAADSAPDIGIVGSRLVDERGTVLEAGCIVYRDGTPKNYGRGTRPGMPETNYLKEVDYVSGACLLVRALLWRELGGFDHRYSPGYFEDADLAFSAREAGMRVLYQPRSTVVHSEGISHGRDVTQGTKRFQVLNRGKFREKWDAILETQQVEAADEYVARDRSFAKTRVLVVDRQIPEFDRDAGGRYTHTYLKLLVEMGFHVVFASDNSGREQRYRENLEQRGIEVLDGPWDDRRIAEWTSAYGRNLDIAYLHRPEVAMKFVDVLRNGTSAKIIYSPVDLRHIREARRWSTTANEEARRLAARFEREERSLLDKVDVVHVVSTYEEEVVRALAPERAVRTLPIFVFHDPPPVDLAPFEARQGLMFVGGFRHQPNPDAALWLVSEILPRLQRELPDVSVALVGSDPPPAVAELAGNGVIVSGWVSDAELRELYERTRVVVCPLRFGAGVKGKVVESLYNGVPVVVTPVAAEGLPNIELCTCIAESPQDFADRVVELYSSRSLWEQQAKAGRRYVRTRFSREAAVAALSGDFGPAESVRRSSARPNQGTPDTVVYETT